MAYEKQDKLHIVTAVAVIRRGDGRILLLKRHENEVVYPGFYTFPGGKVEGNLDELRKLQHVGIEAEFIKVQEIYNSHCDFTPFFADTDKVDFRKLDS